MRDLEDILSTALAAGSEAEAYAFIRGFGLTTQDWVHAVREMAALANSGGGVIVFGLDERGAPNGADLSALLDLEPAAITDRFKKYTGVELGIEKRAPEKAGHRLAALLIPEAEYPIPFTQPGTYPAPAGEQEAGVHQLAAFARGAVCFRHGTKSEPGEQADFVKFFDRRLEQKRNVWLEGIRQVVETPAGKTAVVSYDDEPQPAPSPSNVKPKYVSTDPDRTHPYTPKELIAAFNARVSDRRITNYDILAIRYHYELTHREEFIFQMHMTSPRYSDQFLEWLIACHRADPAFFNRARQAYGKKLLQSRKKRRRRH